MSKRSEKNPSDSKQAETTGYQTQDTQDQVETSDSVTAFASEHNTTKINVSDEQNTLKEANTDQGHNYDWSQEGLKLLTSKLNTKEDFDEWYHKIRNQNFVRANILTLHELNNNPQHADRLRRVNLFQECHTFEEWIARVENETPDPSPEKPPVESTPKRETEGQKFRKRMRELRSGSSERDKKVPNNYVPSPNESVIIGPQGYNPQHVFITPHNSIVGAERPQLFTVGSHNTQAQRAYTQRESRPIMSSRLQQRPQRHVYAPNTPQYLKRPIGGFQNQPIRASSSVLIYDPVIMQQHGVRVIPAPPVPDYLQPAHRLVRQNAMTPAQAEAVGSHLQYNLRVPQNFNFQTNPPLERVNAMTAEQAQDIGDQLEFNLNGPYPQNNPPLVRQNALTPQEGQAYQQNVVRQLDYLNQPQHQEDESEDQPNDPRLNLIDNMTNNWQDIQQTIRNINQIEAETQALRERYPPPATTAAATIHMHTTQAGTTHAARVIPVTRADSQDRYKDWFTNWQGDKPQSDDEAGPEEEEEDPLAQPLPDDDVDMGETIRSPQHYRPPQQPPPPPDRPRTPIYQGDYYNPNNDDNIPQIDGAGDGLIQDILDVHRNIFGHTNNLNPPPPQQQPQQQQQPPPGEPNWRFWRPPPNNNQTGYVPPTTSTGAIPKRPVPNFNQQRDPPPNIPPRRPQYPPPPPPRGSQHNNPPPPPPRGSHGPPPQPSPRRQNNNNPPPPPPRNTQAPPPQTPPRGAQRPPPQTPPRFQNQPPPGYQQQQGYNNQQQQYSQQSQGQQSFQHPKVDYNYYYNKEQSRYQDETWHGHQYPPLKKETMTDEELDYWCRYLEPTDADLQEVALWKMRTMEQMLANEEAKKHAKLIEAQSERNRQMYLEMRDRLMNQHIEQHQYADKFKMKSTQEEQLALISEKCKSDRLSANTNKILLDMISDIARGNPINENKLLEANRQIVEQNEQSKKREAQILGTKVMAKHYDNKLDKPTNITNHSDYDIRTQRRLEPKNVTAAISSFNPESPTSDFADTWRRILSYTRSYSISEESYVDILLLVCRGQAHKIVLEKSTDGSTLNEILEILESLYCTRKTILDDMKDLNTFKRKANESIHKAMARARILVDRLRHMYSAQSWSENCDRIMTSILKQIISTNTRKYVDIEESKKWKLGIVMDFATMLDMVDTYESTHDEIPKADMITSVNACSGVPVLKNTSTTVSTDVLQQQIDDLQQVVINKLSTNKMKDAKKITRVDDKTKKLKELKDRRERLRKTRNRNSSVESTATVKSEVHNVNWDVSKKDDKDKNKSKYYTPTDEEENAVFDVYHYPEPSKEDQRGRSRTKKREEIEDMDTSDFETSRDQSFDDRERSFNDSRRSFNDSRSYQKNGSNSSKKRSYTPDSGTENYHEKNRRRSLEKKQSKGGQRNRSNSNGRNNKQNFFYNNNRNYNNNNKSNGNNRGNYKKNYNNRGNNSGNYQNLNRSFSIENFDQNKQFRYGPKGEVTGCHYNKIYYVTCTSPHCNSLHAEGEKCKTPLN